jgi:pSer/pThr/pTyr-binding forkhead associated (FHA) protein
VAQQWKMRIGGRTLILQEGTYDVGRMSDCWLTLDDELVSRYHARLHVTADGFVAEDLGSRNGTFVNGERIEGRKPLGDGDKLRIGREVMVVLGTGDTTGEDGGDQLRKTLAPGEDTQFPALISQLVEKSLKVGKTKEAERYALALTNQLMSAKVEAGHPTARSCVQCLLSLAERTSGGVWIDRVFKLYATQRWLMDDKVLDQIREALDRIPRIPGTGLRDYEGALRALGKDGAEVPRKLSNTISELADAYGGG